METLLAAQAAVQQQLSELRSVGGDAAVIASCEGQLNALGALQTNVSAASPAALRAMRADVAASVTASASAVQQARTSVANASAADAPHLVALAAATRAEVTSLQTDLFERRIFDKHLTFASDEEETAYRRREAEARGYIAQQLATKTPTGDLNAAGATMGQMLDAHAHGAGDSPEFLPRWNKLVESTHKHREAMRAEGRSTEEFDRNLASSVRRYLRDKGLSEAEIDAKLAAAADPLDVVKPYISNEQDAKALDRSLTNLAVVRATADMPITTGVTLDASKTEDASVVQGAGASPGLEDVMAKFRAAGVTASTAEMSPDAPSSGVNQTLHPIPAKGRSS